MTKEKIGRQKTVDKKREKRPKDKQLWAKQLSTNEDLSHLVVLASRHFCGVLNIFSHSRSPPNNIRLPRPIDHKYCPPPHT